MRQNIEVGDLVILWKPRLCCGKAAEYCGTIFQVSAIYPDQGHCRYCGHFNKGMYASSAGGTPAIGIERLKRIPPLSELDDVKQDEKIHA